MNIKIKKSDGVSFALWTILIAGSLVISSCAGSNNAYKNDINQLRNQLPQIEMPIEFNSDKKAKYQAINIENNQIIDRLTNQYSFSLLGKLFETKRNITILGYLPVNAGTPVVITIDNNGRQKSVHILYETSRHDFGRHTSNVVRILPNRQIVFTENTIIKRFQFEGPDEVVVTDSISIRHKKYLVSRNGAIEVVD
jgi:hypothetical protein